MTPEGRSPGTSSNVQEHTAPAVKSIDLFYGG
jgi:hypothetical protein